MVEEFAYWILHLSDVLWSGIYDPRKCGGRAGLWLRSVLLTHSVCVWSAWGRGGGNRGQTSLDVKECALVHLLPLILAKVST